METLELFFTFLLIFFIYSQLAFQLKKGDELALYEIDYTTNAELNNCANLKQPFIFQFSNREPFFKHNNATALTAEYGSFDTYLCESKDYFENNHKPCVKLSLNAVNSLMNADTTGAYFSHMNASFIEEAGIKKRFQHMDTMLQTPLCVAANYDVLMGTGIMPCMYHTYERKYLYAVGGRITVKMTPWRSNKYMIVEKDYRRMVFSSPLNIWNPQEPYMQGYNKMKFIEAEVHDGCLLYVPPFWFYSVQFEKDNKDTVVYEFNYGSVMNVFANSLNLSMHLYDVLLADVINSYKVKQVENKDIADTEGKL